MDCDSLVILGHYIEKFLAMPDAKQDMLNLIDRHNRDFNKKGVSEACQVAYRNGLDSWAACLHAFN